MESYNFDRVVPLDQLAGYKVADGEPDIRGWEVVSRDGRKIGDVDQLLVDPEGMKVEFIDIDLDDRMTGARDRHTLVPIEAARLDEPHTRVFVDALASTDVPGLPAYAHGPISPDFAADVGRRFGGAQAGTRGRPSQTRIVRSEEQLAVGKRRTVAGEVEVRKSVETEHVSMPVDLAHDEVSVERRPITDRNMAAEARIEGDEIRVPLMQEEAVVEKRVVPTEELVVRKREVTDHERVEADLRKERVDVEGDGRVRDR